MKFFVLRCRQWLIIFRRQNKNNEMTAVIILTFLYCYGEIENLQTNW